MTSLDWLTLILFVIVLYAALTGIVLIFRRFLRLDVGEREKVLQSQIDELQRNLKAANQEIDNLRRQINFLLKQNEESIRKMVDVEHVNEELQSEVEQLRQQSNIPYAIPHRPDRILIVVIGSTEPGMALDLASIRAVRTDTGLEIQVVSDVSSENLKRVLDRARQQQNHVYVHLSVKSDKDGYLIGDEIVDVSWLSSVLSGTIVLLVAGANSDYIGDFLGVVPYVVSMSGDISHRDAALFSRSFWTEIGRGIGPSMALQRSLSKAPGSIREQIVAHWNI